MRPSNSPGPDYWLDFITAMGESFAETVCPPVPLDDASPHECCEAIWRALGEPVTPTQLASLTEPEIALLARSFAEYFESDAPTVAQIRDALDLTLLRWPVGSLGGSSPYQLFTLEEVTHRLDAEFGPIEPEISGLRLIKRAAPYTTEVQAFEREVGLTLPAVFAELVNRYDLGNFTIGQVAFGFESDYLANLRRWNSPRPAMTNLWIAFGDPFSILLDVETDATLAVAAIEGFREPVVVASNLALLIRGLSTAMLARAQEVNHRALGINISEAVGSSAPQFWQEIVS